MKFTLITNRPINPMYLHHTDVTVIEMKPWKGGTALLIEGNMQTCLNLCCKLVNEGGMQALAMKTESNG